MESVDVEEQGQRQRPYGQQEKNVHEEARQQRALNRAGCKKYELCPRWLSLECRLTLGYEISPLVKRKCSPVTA